MICKKVIAKYLLVICIVTVLLPGMQWAFAENTLGGFVEVQKRDIKTPYRGEKVSFYLKLFSPGMFTGSPRFELPSMSTGLLYKVHDRPVLGTENIEGHSYTSQLHEFWFFPKVDGEITIPEINVTFTTSEQRADGERQYVIKTTPFTIKVNAIPGVPKEVTILVTSEFETSQHWEPEFEEGVVGDAVKRTISMRAQNMAAIFLPDIEIAQIQGVSIYRQPPEVNDQNERGKATAERKDIITYLFESEGEYTIPDIKITWWDSNSNTIKEDILKGFSAQIAVNTNTGMDETERIGRPGEGSGTSRLLLYVFGGFALVSLVVYKKYGKITRYIHSKVLIKSQSEKAYFRRFKRACDKNDRLAAYNSMYLWSQKRYGTIGSNNLANIENVNPDLLVEINELNRQLFHKKASSNVSVWNGRRLYKSVKKMRQRGMQSETGKKVVVTQRQINY